MSNKIIDIAAVTQNVDIADTTPDYVPLVTLGPLKAGSFARLSYWFVSSGTDSVFAIYRGAGVAGDQLIATADSAVIFVDDSPVSQYTLAVKGDQSFTGLAVTFSVEQIA